MKRKKQALKPTALVVSLLLLLTITVGGTLAFLITSDGPLTNIFKPSKVTTGVDEDFNGKVKSNVSIQNTGDIDAYIRAAVVITWQDKNGNVYGQAPVPCTTAGCEHKDCGKDYTITWDTDEQTNPAGQWTLAADGFYYWNRPVDGGTFTGILINECKPIRELQVGETTYYLTVEILGSGIQSLPTSVVTEEWESGVTGVVEADDESTGAKAGDLIIIKKEVTDHEP